MMNSGIALSAFVKWFVASAFLLLGSLVSFGAQACTLTLSGIAATPSTVSVGDAVNISVTISYNGCNKEGLQIQSNNPSILAYTATVTACTTSNSNWNCNAMTTSGGITTSKFTVVGNNARSSILTLTYSALSAGTTTLTLTGNFDASSQSVDITVSAPPTADYRFDEAAWNGSTGEVKDSSVGKVDGKAFGGATTVSGKVCNAGTFDGKSKYLSVTGLSNLLSGTATLSFWIKTTQTGDDLSYVAPGVSGVEERGGADDVFWGWINATGKIAVSKGNTLGAQSSSNINSGTWRHIVLTRDQSTGQTKAYVDGLLNNTRTSATGVVTRSFSSIGRIENSYISSAAPFDLDEVKVFSAVLSDAQVSAIYANENAGKNWDGSARVCQISGPHHYELSLPSNSISCLPTTVTVTACADSSNPCTNVSTSTTGTANLTTTGGTISAATLNAGVGTASLSYPAATDGTAVTVSLTNATTAAANPVTCQGGSCATTFNTAGFVFSNLINGAVANIPTQVAGVSSGTYYLRAVKTNTSTMACQSALTGVQSVDFGYECNDPSTCYAANMMSVNGGAATTIARNNHGSHSSVLPVNVTFDANGNAPLTFVDSDVGKVTLWASKTAGGTLLTALTGSTLPAGGFLVKPFDFGVIPCAASVVGDCTVSPVDPGLTGGGSAFATAGKAFKATITARASGGLATPSFGLGSSNATETVSLTRTRVAPTSAGAADGTLGGTTAPARSGFTNGILTLNDLTWSEVGAITLTATNSTFLASATSTTGTTGNVGRFTPNHLDTAIVADTAPIACPAGLTCPTNTLGASGMAYANQPILIQVTAKNASGGTTVNYQGSFAKANTLSAWSAAGSAGTANPGGGALSNTALAATAFSAGVGITPVSTPDITRPTYALATLTTAPTDVYFRAVDTDGITSLRTNPVEAGLKVASGRIHIPNAYGSERLALPLTVTVQYYNGSNWLTSLTDSVTSFDSNLSSTTPTPGNLVATVLTGLGSGITVSYPATAAVVAGVRTITLVAPDVSGNANLSLNAPSYLPSSTARATFGIYKSPLIYRRENY
jgi:MSHA biogenesis protein MshQ